MKTILYMMSVILLLSACSGSSKIPREYGKNNTQYYRLSEFKSKMAIPKQWMGNSEFVKSKNDNCDDCSAEYVANYIGKDGSHESFLGAIDVFTPAQWIAIPAENRGTYVKVGNTGGYVYGYRSAQSNPYDPGSMDAKIFESSVIYNTAAARQIKIEPR